MKIYLLIAFIFIAFCFDVKGQDTVKKDETKQPKQETKKDETKQPKQETKKDQENDITQPQPNHIFNMIRLSIGVCLAEALQDTSGLSEIKSYKDLSKFTNKGVFQTALSFSEFIEIIKKIKPGTKPQEIADLIKTEANLLKYNGKAVNEEKLVKALDKYIQKINPSNNLSNNSNGEKESSTNYLFPISMLLIGLLIGYFVIPMIFKETKDNTQIYNDTDSIQKLEKIIQNKDRAIEELRQIINKKNT